MSEFSALAAAPESKAASTYSPPSGARVALLIARRAALESLRDRATQISSAAFVLVLPLVWTLAVIRPAAQSVSPAALGALMTVYLLVVGLLPTSAATGVAAGQFAGEKEQGNLAPLLASPASNTAIFSGKILGAVGPALIYALVAEVSYLIEIAVFLGPSRLGLLQPALALAMLALVPVIAVFAASIAALISSRVRTYQVAQGLASLALMPVYFIFFALTAELQTWGALALAIGVAVGALGDTALIVAAATTWRREEVLARR
jgi:ABC-type Na+ efflux pump permease subunit